MAHKERKLTRLLQVTIPRESYVLLAKLIQQRVEQDFAPSKATKSVVIADAITRMAIAEGLAEEPPPETGHVPKGKPFELVTATAASAD
jgi:hypothetical protein